MYAAAPLWAACLSVLGDTQKSCHPEQGELLRSGCFSVKKTNLKTKQNYTKQNQTPIQLAFFLRIMQKLSFLSCLP